MRELHIDLISDVVCPFCFIGLHRLEQALSSFPDVQADVELHPFFLDPKTPMEGEDLREYLRRKFGAEPDGMFRRVEAAAAESGLRIDFSKVRWRPNTARAHTLLRHARRKATQRALARALFEAYFVEGRDVGDAEVLVSVAAAHGFASGEARELLSDEEELGRTAAEARAAYRRGVTGVPFTVLADRLAVSGAQPMEVFRGAVEQALSG
jgi:predicted DsbA family dithiol-disulfide isomerase